jgi:nicotinamide-nucleotide amidase
MQNAVELITIGDELLLGFTIDTNSAVLGRALAGQGVSIVRRTAVGDEMDAIVAAIREGLDRTGAVITTGGLGPTTDDLTRDAVAAAFGVPLDLDEAHVAWMQERWKRRFNRDMPDANRRQAMVPRGARKLQNNHGSAPGAFVRDDRGRWLVMLPGVPRELRGMTEDALLPLLREIGCGEDACILSRTLRTTGIPESQLQEQLRDVPLDHPGFTLAYLPGIEGVDLRLTARADTAADATRIIDGVATAIQSRVGQGIYAEGDTDLAAVFLERCRARGATVAVAESCTGGMLGARITDIAGASDVFLGGVIAYANEVKVRDLGVAAELIERHGAVSEEVVRAMAQGARAKFGAAIGLAITGVAGPGGGTAEKPVGTVWVCVATADSVEPRRIHSWGDRSEIRYRAAQSVMDLARRLLGQR